MKKINDNAKVTLTIRQIKKLVVEEKDNFMDEEEYMEEVKGYVEAIIDDKEMLSSFALVCSHGDLNKTMRKARGYEKSDNGLSEFLWDKYGKEHDIDGFAEYLVDVAGTASQVVISLAPLFR